jgi:hypothetical protein
VTVPWSLFKGLPELPRDPHTLPVSMLRPTIPVLFRGPAGEVEKDCLLDTGTDESVFRTGVAHAIGLKPSDCTVSWIEFSGGSGPEPPEQQERLVQSVDFLGRCA